MNIPAIRGIIGDTVFYSTNLSMQQVSDLVKPVDKELHTATALREQIQRALSENYLKIRDYILEHNDHFFSSLVLAIYDGDPLWTEIRYELDGEQYKNVGVIHLNGNEKIFPVDGQHRVEGIKAALKSKPELAKENVSVMLIGHSTDAIGMEKSRRIFSTLNRYAKPVGLGDIIALDEDDIVAIVTRFQLENNILFAKDRVKAYNSIAIPVSDKRSFTSLIALYKCNLELFKCFYYWDNDKLLSPKQLKDYLRNRPSDNVINAYNQFISEFWANFSVVFPEIKKYSTDNSVDSAGDYRSRANGGNIFFRPVFLYQFISAISYVSINSKIRSLLSILQHYSGIPRCVSDERWNIIIWDDLRKRMVTKNSTLLYFLILYMFDGECLSSKSYSTMVQSYQSLFNISEIDSIERISSLYKLNQESPKL